MKLGWQSIFFAISLLPFIGLWSMALVELYEALQYPQTTCWIAEADGHFLTPIEGSAFLAISYLGIWLLAWLALFVFTSWMRPSIHWYGAVILVVAVNLAISFWGPSPYNNAYLKVAADHCVWQGHEETGGIHN